MDFLLISENGFFHEIRRDGITSLLGIHEKTHCGKEAQSYKYFNTVSSYSLTLKFLRTKCTKKITNKVWGTSTLGISSDLVNEANAKGEDQGS